MQYQMNYAIPAETCNVRYNMQNQMKYAVPDWICNAE